MPEVLHRTEARGRGYSFSQYVPPGRQIIFLFIFYLFLLKIMSALFVTNSLLSAGRQDGKIPPAHETPRNQSDYRILFILPARVPKKKKKLSFFLAHNVIFLYLIFIF